MNNSSNGSTDQKNKELQNEGIEAHIKNEIDILEKKKSWEAFNPCKEAETYPNLDNIYNNEQLNFQKFLSVATNFSSLQFAKKLEEIPNFIETITNLLKGLIEKVENERKCSNISNELKNIMNFIFRTVLKVKHSASMMLPVLESAVLQINVIEEVLNPNPYENENAEINEVDKNDIRLALERLSIGANKLLELSDDEYKKEKNLTILNSELTKNNAISSIIELCQKCSVDAKIMGDQITAKNDVLTDYLGELGILVIGDRAFPPITAVIGSYVLGACSQSVICLVKELWSLQQLRNLVNLNKLFIYLVQLDSAITKTMHCMAEVKEETTEILNHYKEFQVCLQNKQRQKENIGLCSAAVQSTAAMIKSLKKISLFKLSECMNTLQIDQQKKIYCLE